MGSLHFQLNFFQNSFTNLDSRVSLGWDTLYFLDSLAPSKVWKFAKDLHRSTCRSPGRTNNLCCQAGIRIYASNDQPSTSRRISEDRCNSLVT